LANDSGPLPYRPDAFHLMFALASMYMAMLFTNWQVRYWVGFCSPLRRERWSVCRTKARCIASPSWGGRVDADGVCGHCE
jgi:hypothetical protein